MTQVKPVLKLPLTVGGAISKVETLFSDPQFGLCFGHGVDSPLDEAIWLLVEISGINLDNLEAHLDDSLTPKQLATLNEAIMSRIELKKPVAYITQSAYLGGFRFYVDERVIVPRSPIAELIEQGFFPWIQDPNKPLRALDMCTGSACLAILMDKYFENIQIDAVDISIDALAVASINCQELDAHRVRLVQSDLFNALEGQLYDIIISNPPYVDDKDFNGRADEFKHEPDLALYADDEGLEIALKIIEQAKQHLAPGGILIIEVGNSSEAMMARYPDMPLIWLEFERGGSGVFLMTAEDLQTLNN